MCHMQQCLTRMSRGRETSLLLPSGYKAKGGPEAPASLICWQNLSDPLRMMGLKYVNMMIGAFIFELTLRTTSITCMQDVEGTSVHSR